MSELRGSITNENVLFTVQRDSQTVEIPVPNELIDKVASKSSFFEPILPFEVDRVTSGMPAEKSGLRKGDKIVSFNGTPIQYYQQLQPMIKKAASKKVELGIERQGVLIKISPTVTSDSAIGFYPHFFIFSVFLQFIRVAIV